MNGPIIPKLSLIRNKDPEWQSPLSVAELKDRARSAFESLVSYALQEDEQACDDLNYKTFEEGLIPRVYALARAIIMLFLTAAAERIERGVPQELRKDGRVFRRASKRKGRGLMTRFGVVRYFRVYMREVVTEAGKARRGFFPLDQVLGLCSDRFSWSLLSLCVRLATKLSFAEARGVASWFLPTVPSTEVLEQATLGFGRHTEAWFEKRPAPEGDGEVLVVMIDSKGIPTATEAELTKRRGKRRRRKAARSPRHRGRQRRKQQGPKKRRKKGDKSKNAKMSTMVVMYTLKRAGRHLLGPINRWVYVSLAPKRHAFIVARREANKRGFTTESGKLIQLVTDGDEDLATYQQQYFAGAIHTLDVVHATEKLWSAGACLFGEATDGQRNWVAKNKQRLYDGKVRKVVAELKRRLRDTPKKGPGNKGRRKRLNEVVGYLEKRLHLMNYDMLLKKDLEISSGPVEGCIKYVVGRRCDHGGMRWIKERAESILQLRCIDLNGDWDAFIQHVHNKTQRDSVDLAQCMRLQQKQPAPLPEIIHELNLAA